MPKGGKWCRFWAIYGYVNQVIGHFVKKKVRWPLDRLDSSDSHCRCSSMDETLLVFLKRFVLYRAALLWIISSFRICSL